MVGIDELQKGNEDRDRERESDCEVEIEREGERSSEKALKIQKQAKHSFFSQQPIK